MDSQSMKKIHPSDTCYNSGKHASNLIFLIFEVSYWARDNKRNKTKMEPGSRLC